jgi:hypothetical protein
MRRIAIGFCVLLIAAPAVVDAGSQKKGRRLLRLLSTVDGQGSGLDADTVRGRTVEEIIAAEVTGPPGPPGPPGPAAGGDLLVRDDTGAIVGKVVGAGSPTVVVREVEFSPGVRRALAFPVTRTGFADTSDDIVFRYGGTDCNGIARFPVDRGVLLPVVQVKRGTNAFTPTEGWFPAEEPDAATPSLLRSRAVFRADDACVAAGGHAGRPRTGMCCFDETITVPAVDALEIDLDAFGFTPPFRVEVPPLP